MTAFEIASLAIASANAAAAIIAAVGIWHGIRAMARANDERRRHGRKPSRAFQLPTVKSGSLSISLFRSVT